MQRNPRVVRIRDAASTWITCVKGAIELTWCSSRSLFLLSLAVTTIGAILPLANIYLNSQLIEFVARSLLTLQPDPEDLKKLGRLVALLCGVLVSSHMLTHVGGVVQRLFQLRVSHHVQGLLAEKTANLDVEHFDNPEFHNMFQSASSAAAHRPLAIVQSLLQIVSSAVACAVIGTIIFFQDWWVLPAIVIPALLMFILSIQVATEAAGIELARVETDRKARYIQSLLTGDWWAKEIRIFALQEQLVGRLKKLWRRIYEDELHIGRKKVFKQGVSGAVLVLYQPLLIGYAASLVIRGEGTLGWFSFFTQSVHSLHTNISKLASSSVQLHEHRLFLENLFHCLALPSTNVSRSSLARVAVRGSSTLLEFRNVSFQYSRAERSAITNISFLLEPGEQVAVVGANGSGKSTIVKLSAGLYQPTSGRIFSKGIDIQELSSDHLRKQMGIVLQDFQIFHWSVYENLAVGLTEQTHDRRTLESVAKACGLDEVIQKLPYKYETILGRYYLRGHELSGGQKQLVAICRAIIRGAPLLILDEATSALDAINEERLMGVVLNACKTRGCATLFVTHRLSSVQMADRILVLSNGSLSECGSHQELLLRNGEYASMWDLQHGVIRTDYSAFAARGRNA